MYRRPTPLFFDPRAISRAGLGLFEGADTQGLGLFDDMTDPRMNPAGVQQPGVRVSLRTPPIAPRTDTGRGQGAGGALRSVTDALGTVFGGEYDPRLSAAENQRAQRQALLRGGLQAMLAAGEGQGLGQVLATGALAGQSAGGQARGGMAQAAQRQRMQQIIAQGAGLPELRQMFQEAIRTGDHDSARSISEVIKAMEAAQNNGAVKLERFQGPDGKVYAFDPRTGQTQAVQGPDGAQLAGAPELDSQDLGDRVVYFRKGNPQAVVHVERKGAAPSSRGSGDGDGTGRAVNWQMLSTDEGVVQVNPRTGETRPVQGPGGGALRSTAAKPSEGERMAGAALRMARQAAPLIDRMERTIAGSVVNRIPVVGHAITTQAEQQVDQAGMQMLGAYNMVVSGKGVTEQEYERNKRTFMPMPGDRPATLRQKANARRTMMQAVEQAAGRAAPPAAPARDPFAAVPRRNR